MSQNSRPFYRGKHTLYVWHYREVESALGDSEWRELSVYLKYMARGQSFNWRTIIVLEINAPISIKEEAATAS